MTDRIKIVRVQDRKGRGPWRPGFSSQWTRDDTPMHGKPIIAYPQALKALNKAHRAGLHVGCAVYEIDLGTWFSASDLARLSSLGFYIADASNCTIIFSAPDQVLIASEFPLAWLKEVRIDAALEGK